MFQGGYERLVGEFGFIFPSSFLLFLESQIPWRIEIGRRGESTFEETKFQSSSLRNLQLRGESLSESGKFVDRKIHNLFSSLILWSFSIIASNRKQPSFERKRFEFTSTSRSEEKQNNSRLINYNENFVFPLHQFDDSPLK